MLGNRASSGESLHVEILNRNVSECKVKGVKCKDTGVSECKDTDVSECKDTGVSECKDMCDAILGQERIELTPVAECGSYEVLLPVAGNRRSISWRSCRSSQRSQTFKIPQ